jgi:hypothetical protein
MERTPVKSSQMKAKKAKHRVKQSAAIVRHEAPTLAEAVEKVLIGGDLAPLNVEQRLQYYKALCKSLGLNPLTKPFAYLELNRKLVLYALRDCTDQLRKVHSVSVTSLESKIADGMCIAKVEVRDKNGRTDAASGAVWVEHVTGLDLANAIMKTETKAKRRATLSICGLGMLDESELDTIKDAHFVTDGGRIIHESNEQPFRGLSPEQKEANKKFYEDQEKRIKEQQAKVSENKTKVENAVGGDSRPPMGQMAQSPKKQENVVLTGWKESLIALSGAGLNIIRSEMTEDDKAFFGIKLYDKSVFCLEEKLVFKFQDLCTRLGVTYTWAEKAKPVTPKNSTLPRAVIPPAPVFPDQPAPAKSTDPILFEAKVIEKEGKKPFMTLNWSGAKHSCFDKGLWPLLLAAIGKPVMLEVKANGKYSNLVRILRIDDMSFEN